MEIERRVVTYALLVNEDCSWIFAAQSEDTQAQCDRPSGLRPTPSPQSDDRWQS